MIWISCLIIFPVGRKCKHFHALGLIWFLLEASSFLHDHVSPRCFQELEFSNLFAVLHCIHAFFAAKVACLDPMFVSSRNAAMAPVVSATSTLTAPSQISKLKYTSWQTPATYLLLDFENVGWEEPALTNEWTSTLKQTIEVCNIENLAISSDSNVSHCAKSWMNFEHFSIKFPAENLSAVVARSLEKLTISLWYCGISVCIQMILTLLCVYF